MKFLDGRLLVWKAIKILFKNEKFRMMGGGKISAYPVIPRTGLKEGEKILWYGKPKFASIMGRIILSILLIVIGLPLLVIFIGLIFLLVGIIILTASILQLKARTYFITNIRVVEEYTLFRKIMKETTLDHVTDVVSTQGLLGRILNYGNIHVHTAGTGFPGIDFKNIGDPLTVRGILINAKDSYKK